MLYPLSHWRIAFRIIANFFRVVNPLQEKFSERGNSRGGAQHERCPCPGQLGGAGGAAHEKIGNRLPTILGPTFTFLTPAIAISVVYGYEVFLGAALIGGLVMALVGTFFVNQIKKLFPPLVLGCVIMVIGIALFGVGIDYIAGGDGAANYGSWQNYLVGGVMMLLVIVFHIFGKGCLKGASVLVAMVVGTVLALVLAVGIGFNVTSAALERFPYFISALLNGIPGTAITATVLNLLLPKEKKAAAPACADAAAPETNDR